MQQLDKVDFSILGFLQENGKRPYSNIADLLGVSEGTVRSRVKKMLDNGVFEFVVHTNPDKVGLHVQAIIGFSTQLGKQEDIAKKLKSFQEVRFVGAFSGMHDLIIQAYFRNNESLVHFVNHQLSQLEGIQSIDVSVELKEYKDSFSYVLPEGKDKESGMEVDSKKAI
ncbi:Lrp/AsnC family transcriptional regulator [Thalassorhabdus alkalitolerans]|uniref:Lrp/AsnC family transcriptional regulator n=1 Tax=Thalassorhabdus alkalitolerans TaxID=2282697 RepID=A0ABW0YSD3_9BACI|nr:Lrp/AsnC family transcriptional regulator [Thalassobacillus sp. C254]